MSLTSNEYIKDITDFTEPTKNEKSEIAPFFAHTNILITGGTGFLGSLLIEKLLRNCPDIAKIYVIIRSKKGKTALERFHKIFENVIYDKLRYKQTNFLEKIVMLEGDATKDDYGLSSEDKNLLMNVNIIFHVAATVRFEEKLRTAININVKSTKFLLKFAQKLPNFKVFVHVSTAFAPCTENIIDEKHYKNTIDADKALELLDIFDDKKLEQITPILLDNWPNTYIYSKALGENMILKYSGNLPICIVRPSIVTSTFNEPVSGWINNIYGVTGVIIGSAIGLLHTLPCKAENVAEVIPADYVISNIICSAWDTVNRKLAIKPDQVLNLSDEERIPIYNCVSSCQNRISWAELMKINEIYGLEIPSEKCVSYYSLTLNRYLFMHKIYALIFHIIPALIIDIVIYLIGRKPILLDAYKKIHKFSNLIHYFSINDWKFQNKNVINLWQKMNSTDREIFCFNIEMLDWNEYFYQGVRGLRYYILNDSMDTIDAAKRKFQKLRIAYYTFNLAITLLFLWIVFSFINFFWSFCPLSH
ncbi:fatty acyl-CoA reductase wat [Apis mellifera caucasica]|uniref:Fatty acyl-CoA reductase n=1 Tax=Apis mellifera TaxID=7460 RepID=A0A7M7MS86_APIME|nr:fatty acyl-CoA reductase wat [Apis mellifera]KAG6795790.1 fatty acyl-CoA reductase wat [Apis mellifera caucasica]KAG9429973.1 fatty acyl-CoA reductase wat [Apis mellifera carnica]|eukprot:XP_026300187.1 fatty acyl-CoA reductase wat [Apis mellifera]